MPTPLNRLIYMRRYRAANRAKISAWRKSPKQLRRSLHWYKKNHEAILSRRRSHYRKNASRIRTEQRIRSRRSRSKTRQYIRRRYHTDLRFRITHLLRGRMLQALKENHKTGSALILLGCSIEKFKHHLESLFQPGMNWENHGTYIHGKAPKWHIDHIKPCASFDLNDPEQQKACFHWTNMQPLWGYDNISKGAKTLDTTIQT